MFRKIAISIAVLLLFYACRKAAPFDKPTDDQFSRHYCNDPIAVNYNFGFPGTVDSSVCIYPTDVFTGTYFLKDSIYNGEFELDTVLDYTIMFHVRSLTELRVTGFCPSGDSIKLTADRYYKAAVDSMILPDSSLLNGQVLCRPVDTLSGTISKYNDDSTKIRISFVIASDTGVSYHFGTGTKK